ncbi:MAG: DinB family protein [bacterium]|nr:DinB family protein [bacterium]
MTINNIIDALENNLPGIEALLINMPEVLVHWRPGTNKWSVLEIVNHMADEEVEDFRTRVRLTLDSPANKWPPIDPEGWVTGRRYQHRSYTESLNRFKDERLKSLEWLKTLGDAPWKNEYNHPAIGPLSAITILENWLAHDYLHIRQIIANKWKHLNSHRTGSRLDYAGLW